LQFILPHLYLVSKPHSRKKTPGWRKTEASHRRSSSVWPCGSTATGTWAAFSSRF
jgi:hypothetical protein